MKKFILSALCAITFFTFSSNANAQLLSNIEGMPPYKLGVTAGFNASSFSADKFNLKPGFNVGVDLMLDASEIIKDTYLRVNLLVQCKGATFKWLEVLNEPNPLSMNSKSKAHAYYLEIPIDYGYAKRLNKDWTLMGETGPYLAFGIGGRYDTKNFNENNSMTFFGNNIKKDGNLIFHSPKRRDFGWNLAICGLFQNVHQIKVGYQFGFLNMNDEFQQNRNLMVNYTYFFE